MKYSIVAKNCTLNFEEHDNIRCYEGYFTAKNVEILLGNLNSNHVFIGIHIIGNNTAASGTILIGGSVNENGGGSGVVPLMMGVGMMNGIDTFYGQGEVNWWISNFVLPVTIFPSFGLKMKIDNSSTFTGGLYIRAFFKLR